MQAAARRAGKQLSHCSEPVTGFKLPMYFFKAERCERDPVGKGAQAAHRGAGSCPPHFLRKGWRVPSPAPEPGPSPGRGPRQSTRLSPPYCALSLDTPPARCRVAWRDFSFNCFSNNFWTPVSSGICILGQAVHFRVSQCTGATGTSLCLEFVFKHASSVPRHSFTCVYT